VDVPPTIVAPTQLAMSVSGNSGELELVIVAIVSEPVPVADKSNDALCAA
jgi:hypothetical protein